MATLDPETIDLKKSLLDAASRNKVSIFTPTPEVPVDPAIAAEYAKLLIWQLDLKSIRIGKIPHG
jgi:hypothetical protein